MVEGNLTSQRTFATGFFAAMITLIGAGNAAAAEEARPNFILVYADDWRWDALGVVQREQGEQARFPWLQTPRLDELAAESVRFGQSFVVNSLCSPGRACVLTSRYSHANGVINNHTPLPTDAVNVATRLKDAGYATAYCGKWHMNGQRERPGFDYTASFVGQGRYNDCPILLNGRQTPTEGWIDDVSTDYAIEFLEQQSKEKPFFLFLGFKSPHGPRGGKNLPERVRELYEGETSRPTPNVDVPAVYAANRSTAPAGRNTSDSGRAEGHRAYMRHITAIDECVGRLLDALDETGQAANTIVIVTSDNGYYLGEHGLGDKRSAYDESLRVPLMIRLPGESAGRVVDDAMVLNVDYAPTLLDFAGADPLPESHGRSLRPLLEGASPADWRTAFLYEYFKERKYASPTVLAVRTPTHKLITYPGHDEWTEAFDLASDPYETKNQASDEALVQRLRREFDEQAHAVDYRMPEGVPTDDETPARRPKRRARQ
jgi:N-acetylglucosamine-6-sulfatase